MATFVDKQAKVDAVIDKYGASIVITPVTGTTYSEDTGFTDTTSTSSTIKAIVYDYLTAKFELAKFGNNKLGELNLIVKGTQVIDKQYKVSYNSKTYYVQTVSNLPLGETNLGKLCTLSEVL
jgi:hypothetical protein